MKLINFQVAVLGEVEKPGNFTIDKDQINLLQAISMAGGLKEFGRPDKITLVRQTLQGSEVHTLNLQDKKVLESDYFYLMPNDVIYVEPIKGRAFLGSKFPYPLIFSTLSIALSATVIYLELK